MKANIYIYQFLGILLLLGGYLFSNTPDSLSEMYFNSDPACPSVFSKGHKSPVNDFTPPTKVCSKNDPKHRSNVITHISYDVIVPEKLSFGFHPVILDFGHTYSLIERYNYLYYIEINPPPPRMAGSAGIA